MKQINAQHANLAINYLQIIRYADLAKMFVLSILVQIIVNLVEMIPSLFFFLNKKK